MEKDEPSSSPVRTGTHTNVTLCIQVQGAGDQDLFLALGLRAGKGERTLRGGLGVQLSTFWENPAVDAKAFPSSNK